MKIVSKNRIRWLMLTTTLCIFFQRLWDNLLWKHDQDLNSRRPSGPASKKQKMIALATFSWLLAGISVTLYSVKLVTKQHIFHKKLDCFISAPASGSLHRCIQADLGKHQSNNKTKKDKITATCESEKWKFEHLSKRYFYTHNAGLMCVHLQN